MLFVVIAGTVLVFGAVLLRGAPYLPTMKKQADLALDLLDLKPGQTLLELGSGDGAVVLAAAKRGLVVVGYELNPLLVIISKIRCRKFKHSVTIIWGDYWQKSWPESDGMFVFLLDRFMIKLDNRIVQYTANTSYRVVSNTFYIPKKSVHKSVHGLHLYLYNAVKV